MQTPVRVRRYGSMVWETPKDAERKDDCMCLHCSRMKPDEDDHCSLAAAFYEVCRNGGNAFIMTRCGDWCAK